MKCLDGRIAIVTGGGGVIGKAVCISLAQDGAIVIICDINDDKAITTLESLEGPQKHMVMILDVTKTQDIFNLVDNVVRLRGVPDILVNCAAINLDAHLTDMTEEMFDKVLAVNLKGAFFMTQNVCKIMIQHGVNNGAIVNLSHDSATDGSIRQCNYVSSKAGIEMLTKTACLEMGCHGIRINAIRVGLIDIEHDKEGSQLDQAELLYKRKGTPKEVADVCKFLVSDKSSYITGAIFEVSGGLF